MRFASLSSIVFVLIFAIISVVKAHSYEDSGSLVRRGHGDASASSSAMASTESTETSGKNKGSSSTSAASASSTAGTNGHSSSDSTTTTTNAKNNNKAAQYGNFASPYVLEGGTLFYIGISVTTLLWVTGKIIDVKTERQERYAESLIHRT